MFVIKVPINAIMKSLATVKRALSVANLMWRNC